MFLHFEEQQVRQKEPLRSVKIAPELTELLCRLLDRWLPSRLCWVGAKRSNIAQVGRFKALQWWMMWTPTMQCPWVLTWGLLDSTIKPVNTSIWQQHFTYPFEQKDIICFLLSWFFINLLNRHFVLIPCSHIPTAIPIWALLSITPCPC